MTARVDTEWQYRGIPAVVLENEFLRVDLFPEAGAKIFNFIYKPLDYNFMWHHPQIGLEKVPLGLAYDDYFSGGWDELFPNDAPESFGGLNLPDHGELWCRPWECDILNDGPAEVTIHLKRRGAVTSTVVEKWITLRADEKIVRFHHRISNQGKDPLQFLWKLHPALVASEHHRVDVPGRHAEYVSKEWSRLDDPDLCFEWPNATNSRGERADLRFPLSIATGKRDFLYVTGLEDGWCSVTDTERRVGFALRFPIEVFPSVWLFMPHGGWRDIQTVILEPCTAYPKDLSVARRHGTIATLGPGATLECDVSAVAFAGVTGVGGFTPNGDVIGA